MVDTAGNQNILTVDEQLSDLILNSEQNTLIPVEDDSDLFKLKRNDIDNIKLHINQYTNILEGYSVYLTKSLKFKNTAKKVLFWLSFGVITLIVLVLIILIMEIILDVNYTNNSGIELSPYR